MPIDYWEQVVYHPQALMKTSDLLKRPDPEILDILAGVMDYRYGDFEPTFIEIMELDRQVGKKVLEIGSGCGTDTVKMTMLGANVTAVDVLPSNVAVVSKNLILRNLVGHTIHVLDLMELDITKDFDVLYSFGCLHHIERERIKGIFEHLLSFLKPGATILLMVYTKKVSSVDYHEGDVVVCYNEEEIRDTFSDKVEILELSKFHGGDFWKIKGILKGESRPTDGAILQFVSDEGEQIIKLDEGEIAGYEVESITDTIKTTEVEGEDKRYEIESMEEIVEKTEVEPIEKTAKAKPIVETIEKKLPEGEDYSEDVKEQFAFLFPKEEKKVVEKKEEKKKPKTEIKKKIKRKKKKEEK